MLMTSVPDAAACDVHRVETLSVANFSFDVTHMPSWSTPSVVRDCVRDVPRVSGPPFSGALDAAHHRRKIDYTATVSERSWEISTNGTKHERVRE